MNYKFVKFCLIAFLALLCFSEPIFSQVKCNLKLNVYEFKDDGTSEQFPVKDFNVKVFEAETDKQIKLASEKSPIIKDLEEKVYKLLISKEGFQKTITKIKPICSLADLENNFSKIIFLWKGDSNQTFKGFLDGIAIAGTTRIKAKDSANSEPSDINKNAVYLGKPIYPAAARLVGAKGTVQVEVILDELGYVISAKAISGHPLLKGPSVTAAKESKFKMTYLEGIPVKVQGIITYVYN